MFLGLIMILDFLDDEMDWNFWNPYIFKFKTNAQSFNIQLELNNKIKGYYPHLGITAIEGIMVMFRFEETKYWYNFDAFSRKSNININMKHIMHENIAYEIMIYGPILTSLNKFIVEIPNQYFAEKITPNSNKKITILGGLQSHGIGCTTAGVMFPHMLSREFESELYKITFNDANYIKKIHDFLMGINSMPYCDIGILEIDYFSQNDFDIEYYLLKIINFMKKYCNKVICWFTLPNNKEYKKNKIYKILKQEIKFGNIIIKDFSFLHNAEYYDMCTYSHKFINDAGNIMIFKELKKCILENTEWSI